MRTSAPPLLAIFRSRLQGDLLARVLLGAQPATISQLALDVGAPVATVQRELVRLETAGVLTSHRIGRARLFSGQEDNPALPPLRELVTIAFGPAQVIGEEFAALDAEVLLFGSWAARHAGETGPPPGDVDVLLVGRPDRDDAYEAAERAQARLHRPVNNTIVSPERWEAADEPFLREIKRRPTVLVHRTEPTHVVGEGP